MREMRDILYLTAAILVIVSGIIYVEFLSLPLPPIQAPHIPPPIIIDCQSIHSEDLPVTVP